MIAVRTVLGFLVALAVVALVPSLPGSKRGALSAQVRSVRVGAELGRVIPVSVFEEGRNLTGRPIRTTTRLAVEVGWRWFDHELGEPEYGLGLSRPGFRGTDELGSPVTVFGFTRLPVLGKRGGRLLTFDAHLGTTLGWREFDPVENSLQISIGTPVSATLALGLSGSVPVGGVWALVGDVRYHHWSNGNLRQPNIGLNAWVGGLALEWHRAAETSPRSRAGETGPAPSRAARDRGWSLVIQPFLGARGLAADTRHSEQDDQYDRQLLPVAGVHAGIRRPMSRLWEVAVMASGTLDSSGFRDHRVPELKEGPIKKEAAFAFGLSTSAFLRTGPVELEAGVGYDLVDLGGTRGISRWSQRLGVHFTAVPGVTPSIVLRALGFDRPNFIEWGVAIR